MNDSHSTNEHCDTTRCGEVVADAFPFLASQGRLREHWYPAAFSNALKPGKTLRQVILGVPVLVWRVDEHTLRGFIDLCPHRQAQLSNGTVGPQGISCPYHGWRFGSDGQCNLIPVSPPELMPRESVSLTSVPVHENGGMIWAWMGTAAPTAFPTELDRHTSSNGWKFTRATRLFPYELDDVIENFMDFAHTPVVHPGLIRGISSATERGVTIETTETSVRAVHDPVDEKVGFLSGMVIPKGKLVQHSDTFFMPGNVKVDYWFGDDPPKFFAYLGMTPVAEKQTLILLTIGVQFGWLNPVISLALPTLVRKVLDQDRHILAQQRANLDLVSKRQLRSLQSDAVDATVRALRSHRRDAGNPRPKPGTKRMRVLL